MDVLLLSRLLKELIIDNERIPLPGMGYFLTEPTSAFFSEDRKTIYPPSKRISFKGDDMAKGDILAAYFAKSCGIDADTARTELDTFLQQLKITLNNKKSIDFPGMGRLRLTQDGNLFFAMDTTDGGLFAQVFGFEPIVLKPVNKSSDTATSKEDTAPASSIGPVPVNQPGELMTEQGNMLPKQKTLQSSVKRNGIWVIVLSVLAAIIIAAVILILLGRSGHLDSLIYSDEELELIQQQGA